MHLAATLQYAWARHGNQYYPGISLIISLRYINFKYATWEAKILCIDKPSSVATGGFTLLWDEGLRVFELRVMSTHSVD